MDLCAYYFWVLNSMHKEVTIVVWMPLHKRLFAVEKTVRDEFVARGFTLSTSLQSTKWIVSKQWDMGALPGGSTCTEWPNHQLFNHVPGATTIATKVGLANTLREWRDAVRSEEDKAEVDRIMPPSHVMSDRADCEAFARKWAAWRRALVICGLICRARSNAFKAPCGRSSAM